MKVLVQTKEYVAVHKPSGLATYSDDRRVLGARELLEKQIKRKVFPVHRIDKDTCGVLVFAFTPAMAKNLTALFRTRVVKKQYLAIVHGSAPERGVIDQPLERHKEKGVMDPSVTEFTRMGIVELELEGEERSYSLVRCEPKTGRYHQLRRHLRMIGHPIVGDPEHGNAWDNRVFEAKFGVKRTLLSAVHLAFPDRAAQKMVRLHSKPDPDFLRVSKAFGWDIK